MDSKTLNLLLDRMSPLKSTGDSYQGQGGTPEPTSTKLPLFCAQTNERTTGQTLYINYKSSDSIPEPDVHLDEATLIEEIRNPSSRIEQFKVPLQLSQIFWSKSEDNDRKQNYVVNVEINDKFALRQVIASEIIRHYVVSVTMVSIEEKFNQSSSASVARQFIGHKLNLDHNNYEILKKQQHIEHLDEPVNNKVVVVVAEGKSKDHSKPREIPALCQGIEKLDCNTNQNYDLHFRPASMILTCSVSTDRCPQSFAINDDRILVELEGRAPIDIHLPLQMDLSEPAKYKFYDKLCLFRLVVKLLEPPLK